MYLDSISASKSTYSKIYLYTILFFGVILLSPTNILGQEVCYAIDDVGNSNANLYSWTEAGIVDSIGVLNAVEVETITLNGDCNEIYTTSEDMFGSVDLSTGLFTEISNLGNMTSASLGSENINDVDGMAIDNQSGYIYAVERKDNDPDLLFLIDPSNGTVVSNAFGPGNDYVQIPGALQDIDDIAFHPVTFELWGVSTVSGNNSTNDRIVKIDINTGQATTVANLSTCDMEGLTFNDDGELFGSSGYNEDCETDGALYKFDFSLGTTLTVANGGLEIITSITGGGGDVEAIVCCVTAPDPGPITCTIDEIISSCSASGASLEVIPNGGTGGYTYLWAHGPTTKIISGLLPGSYTVTVSDFAGSQTICSYSIGNCNQECCENLISNGGFESYSSSFTFPQTFEGRPAQTVTQGSYIANNWVAASDNDYQFWLIDDSANQVNNPEGDFFLFIKGQGDCAQLCGVPSQSCDISNLLCANWENGHDYELCFDAAAWTENFIGDTPAGPGSQSNSQVVVEVETQNGANTTYANATLPASSSFSNLNWTNVCATFSYSNGNPIRSIYITQNGSTGMVLDNVIFRDLDEPCCVQPEGPTSWNYGCDDNISVEVLGMGILGSLPSTLNIPNPGNVVSMIAEVSFKHNVNECIEFSTSNETIAVSGSELQNLGCSSAYTYRTNLLPASYVTVTGIDQANAQSLIVYVYRQDASYIDNVSQGRTIDACIYQTQHCESFTIPSQPLANTKEITVTVPLSDVTNNSKIVHVHLTACEASSTTTVDTWDPAYGNSLAMVEATLTGIRGNCTTFQICVDSPPSSAAQSVFMSGAVSFEVKCCPVSCSLAETNPITCYGGSDGSITATVVDGSPPYSYNWTDGQTTPTATGLQVGDHYVTVTDAKGCKTRCSMTLNQPPRGFEFDITNFNYLLCEDDSDGTVTLAGTGGTAPYTYTMSGQGTNNTGVFSGLSYGYYAVTVEDFEGCQFVGGVNMTYETCDGSYPNLEMFSGPGNPTGQGPTNSYQTVTLQENTNDPTGNFNSAYSPPLTVAFALLNQQYTNVPTTDMPTQTGMNFGARNNNGGVLVTSADIYGNLDVPFDPLDDMFTSAADNSPGTGIDVDVNQAILIYNTVKPLQYAGLPTNDSYYYGDLQLSFNQPVDYPIIHVAGLGGYFGGIGYTTDFELLGTNQLRELSGNHNFEVVSNTIYNVSNNPNSRSATGAASGSAIVDGTDISILRFRVYIRGTISANYVIGGTHTGDALTMGVSLLKGIPDQCCVQIFSNGFIRTNSKFIPPIESDLQSTDTDKGK